MKCSLGFSILFSCVNTTFIPSQRRSQHIVIIRKPGLPSLVLSTFIDFFSSTMHSFYINFPIILFKKKKKNTHCFGNSKWHCHKCMNFMCYVFLFQNLYQKGYESHTWFHVFPCHLLVVGRHILDFRLWVLI